MGVVVVSRLMAVDPGDVRIGLAVSDESGIISRPLKVIPHRSRSEDALKIIEAAKELEVGIIVVGLALDANGDVGPQARKALRLVDALRRLTDIPVETWDETGSSKAVPPKFRKVKKPIDAIAAAHILQEYLNATKTS
jgi:putative Holliday junction resolvase